MFDLRLTTPDLHLRHLTEADLATLAAILPDDAEQDPASTSYPGLDRDRNRAVVLHQDYWRARGSWCPESWALSFGVFRDGELVGFQGLEGDDFARLRTVDSSSFLAHAARGQGLGKQMRAAVLALAFARQAGRGAYMITATPTRQSRAPATSYRSGRNPSSAIPHANDPTTKTPP